MSTRKTAGLPARLERIRQRFEHWRRSRRKGARIPEGLWAAAVEAAGEYGMSRTASALGVDYYSLKKRQGERTARSRELPSLGELPAFLELAAPLPETTSECILELEDGGGARMRVHLKAAAAPDLAALSRSFWEARS
jgi:hypothetical protein